MSETTPNDVAFIKVSRELYMIRNTLSLLEGFRNYVARMDQWSKQKLVDLDTGQVVLEEFQGFIDIMPFLVDDGGEKLKSKINKLNERSRQLDRLVNTYLKGGDIVAAKLGQ